jgi:hypothetical protein
MISRRQTLPSWADLGSINITQLTVLALVTPLRSRFSKAKVKDTTLVPGKGVTRRWEWREFASQPFCHLHFSICFSSQTQQRDFPGLLLNPSRKESYMVPGNVSMYMEKYSLHSQMDVSCNLTRPRFGRDFTTFLNAI